VGVCSGRTARQGGDVGLDVSAAGQVTVQLSGAALPSSGTR
jgi:hypothetical protein